MVPTVKSRYLLHVRIDDDLACKVTRLPYISTLCLLLIASKFTGDIRLTNFHPIGHKEDTLALRAPELFLRYAEDAARQNCDES